MKKFFSSLSLGLVLCFSLILSEISLVHAQPIQESAEKRVKTEQISLLVDTQRCKMLVFQGSKVIKTFPVAVGTKSTPSPIGNWRISFKAANWGSGFGARFMGLNVSWGKYGIHGTNKPWSVGSRASHGCIRMQHKDVIELYNMVQTNTPVIITGNPFVFFQTRSTLFNGHRGRQVVLAQEALRRLGFYEGNCDGIFGYGTEAAIKAFQKAYKLPVTGQIQEADFKVLGL